MWVVSLSLREFRSYASAELELGPGLTVISGPNGAGKTNLVEGLYFGCTARSCRTANEREIVRFGAGATRVVVRCQDDDGGHEIAVGFAPGEAKRISLDGAPVERLLEAPGRPLVSVFLPDRLELVKGPPALRRSHVDQLVAALWPSRALSRRAYGQALAQRNALLLRVRRGAAESSSLATWDRQLAAYGLALMEHRQRAVDTVADGCRRLGAELGLPAELSLIYRPRSRATTPGELAQELESRLEHDLERGFSTHGPHRDELSLRLADRELRTYGSQGQQRLALLSLLLAEREAIAARRGDPPLMLLDDVLSELDAQRRTALVSKLADDGGQAVITTTDADRVPGLQATHEVELIEVDCASQLTPSPA